MINKKSRPYYVGKAGNLHVPVYECEQKKKGKRYSYFSVAEYVDGKRQCKAFSDPEAAKAKADEIAQATARREPELLAFAHLKRPIRNALEALQPTGLRIDRGARLLADALQIISGEELLNACRYWRDQRPGGGLIGRSSVSG